MEIKLTLPGEPRAQKRPRFARRGNFVSTYDPDSKAKEILAQGLKLSNPPLVPEFPPANPIVMTLDFYFQPAKGAGWQHCTNKFDLDNLEKFVLDCFNGLFYKDDRQIIKLNSTKYYDLVPRTEITINYLPMRSLNKILEKISPYEFYDLYILCQKIVILYDEHRMKESLQHLTPEQQEIACELLAEMTKFLPALKKIEKEIKNA